MVKTTWGLIDTVLMMTFCFTYVNPTKIAFWLTTYFVQCLISSISNTIGMISSQPKKTGKKITDRFKLWHFNQIYVWRDFISFNYFKRATNNNNFPIYFSKLRSLRIWWKKSNQFPLIRKKILRRTSTTTLLLIILKQNNFAEIYIYYGTTVRCLVAEKNTFV